MGDDTQWSARFFFSSSPGQFINGPRFDPPRVPGRCWYYEVAKLRVVGAAAKPRRKRLFFFFLFFFLVRTGGRAACLAKLYISTPVGPRGGTLIDQPLKPCEARLEGPYGFVLPFEFLQYYNTVPSLAESLNG